MPWKKREFAGDVATAKHFYDVIIWAWDCTEGWSRSVMIEMDGVYKGANSPYTFKDLIGTHNFTVEALNTAYHPFSDWDTGWTDETITVNSPGTYTARYREGYSATIWSLDSRALFFRLFGAQCAPGIAIAGSPRALSLLPIPVPILLIGLLPEN